MGHNTGTVFVEASDRVNEHTALDAAISKWYDEEANRWDDARPGYGNVLALTGPAAAKLSYSTGSVRDGHSIIVPVTNDFVTKTEKVKLSVTADQLAELRRGYVWEFLDTQAFGLHVSDAKVIQLPRLRAPKAEATEGKAVTKYRIVGLHGMNRRSDYPSQAEARAAAIEYMKENPETSSLSVEAFIVRDTGKSALVTITRPEAAESTVTFEVTRQVPKPNAKVAGYHVAFDYHH